jgi:hypothetical protein
MQLTYMLVKLAAIGSRGKATAKKR